MSLPDAPNTLREKYYSVMAGQNDADILPDIETAPSTENRYLDYIARNGGGGGDVTKDYVDEQDAKKTDKVTSAISGNFAGLDANGNLTDSGKKATDFATAADVTGEDISSTSTTSPLTDSADGYVQGLTVKGHSEVVDGAIKSVGDAGWGVVDLGTLTWGEFQAGTQRWFSNALANLLSYGTRLTPLYCQIYDTIDDGTYDLSRDKVIYTSANPDAYIFVQDHAFTDATAFKSAMSGVLLYYPLADATGATPTLGITSKNGEGQGTAATITTGLPLRSVSDSITDELTEIKVIKKCGSVKGSDLTWQMISNRDNQFAAQISDKKVGVGSNSIICSDYITSNSATQIDKSIWAEYAYHQNDVVIHDSAYSDATAFAAAVADMEIIYPLATPTETPLSTAEKSALASLRTYDHTTHIDATDAPTMTVDYLLNTDNGKAVANIQRDLQEQIDDLGGSFAETVLYDNTNLATVGAVNVTQNLLQPYTDFDEIRVEYAYFYTGTVGNNIIYPFIKTYTVEELETMRTSQYNGRKGYIVFIVLQGMYLALDIVNASQFKISELNSQSQYQHYITKITGIKY